MHDARPPGNQEIWRPIELVDGNYAVSSLGRVRRETESAYAEAGRICKQRPAKNGYPAVSMYCIRTRRIIHTVVHKLVAHAFLGPRPAGQQVNHRDGVKANNAVTNLEYVTRHENYRHAMVNSLYRHKLTPDDVRTIRNLASTHSQSELGRMYGVRHCTIGNVIHRKTHTWVD